MSEQVETPVEAPSSEETATQPLDILTDEGKFNEAWRNSLPDDLGKHSIWSKYDNVTDLVKGAINAQSQVGKKAEDFWLSEDTNDIARRREIMNIPKDVEGYSLDVGEIPEGTELDEARIGSFKDVAHELGLTNEQAQAIVNWEVKSGEANLQNIEQAEELSIREAEDTLRKEWTGDNFEYNMGKVANVMDYLGLEEFKDDPAIGNNVDFIKAVYENIVPLISEDQIIEEGVEQNYATVSDQLDLLEEEMRNYEGNTSDIAYQNMLKQRLAFLEKIS
jgi:hypothetical protein